MCPSLSKALSSRTRRQHRLKNRVEMLALSGTHHTLQKRPPALGSSLPKSLPAELKRCERAKMDADFTTLPCTKKLMHKKNMGCRRHWWCQVHICTRLAITHQSSGWSEPVPAKRRILQKSALPCHTRQDF